MHPQYNCTHCDASFTSRNTRNPHYCGQRFGRWLVLTPAQPNYWHCRCDCGSVKPVAGGSLRKGYSSSCGCLRKETVAKRSQKHSDYVSKEYTAWSAMLRRCRNSKDPAYPNYGGRGITVCTPWHTYTNFLRDMGRAPSTNHSIDRINNDSNYDPINCRWATAIEQNSNKRGARLLPWRGLLMTAAAWERHLGVAKGTIQDRLRAGWSVEDALLRPIDRKARRQ